MLSTTRSSAWKWRLRHRDGTTTAAAARRRNSRTTTTTTTATPNETKEAVNPLECRGDYSATPSNMKLIHWLLVGGVLHLVQREGTGWGHSPPWPLFAVPNVTTHPSMASAPITILQYNGPLLCGFNVPIKGLN